MTINMTVIKAEYDPNPSKPDRSYCITLDGDVAPRDRFWFYVSRDNAALFKLGSQHRVTIETS